MATTRYAQNVAVEQIPFQNYPGGGITNQGTVPYAQFNDSQLEIGDVKEVTAIYQMYGNEVANDIINLYLAEPGTMVSPIGSVSQRSPGTTMTLDIGDNDTTGVGLVSGLNNNAATRYASAINTATGQTNPVNFSGGDALTDPYQIGVTATVPGANVGNMPGGWVQAMFHALTAPTAGGVLIFRLKVIKN